MRASIVALFAGVLAWPAVAQAQSNSQNAPTRTELVERITIVKSKDMDFGRLAVDNNPGTVTLNPTDSETCTTSANVVHSGSCIAAEFTGVGTTNRRIRIRKPRNRRIFLTGPGRRMQIRNVVFGYTEGLQRLTARTNRRSIRYRITDANGAFLVKLGGQLRIRRNQAPGVYSGTFNVDVDYQ
ncbi:DUF4402 domain-containing protein [Erythrobacter jejuensis]|uniref:DUF4402 domain-containing protein n=1 Tax=Parerythrobacter jejuensis TaxID=795812 RepID=A0A845AP26_9SPHN|nr:DUF4402 domain-containing protein [Parerythrobacter jejuensis]MXP33969.1 DUF4402 domain-containing protein [Parerythrobacter jejuensis]